MFGRRAGKASLKLVSSNASAKAVSRFSGMVLIGRKPAGSIVLLRISEMAR
jgi:hypothetical protein